MRVLLLSTYDLGHQPFALASLAAFLSSKGAEVVCNDLAAEPLREAELGSTPFVAIHLAMHTATRLALELLPRLKHLNPNIHICFFGLYAPMTGEILKAEKNMTFVGGEFEAGVADIYSQLNKSGSLIGQDRVINILQKNKYHVPNRDSLPDLEHYAYLKEPDGFKKISGYTEASRGCKHLCRHCPVVPIYGGRFFIVPEEIVMTDIRRLVKAGAEHITFGDPDFFNGPKHGMNIIKKLNKEFPDLGYDVIIKVEHLLKHQNLLSNLVSTGCRFVTTAVESINDDILFKLKKGHTLEDFRQVVKITKTLGLPLSPTFIPFTPWSTPSNYLELLKTIVDLGLVDNVASVQLSIRLLIPLASNLLELDEIKESTRNFNDKALSYNWHYNDPNMDTLENNIRLIVEEGESQKKTRREIFLRLWEAARKFKKSSDNYPDKINFSHKDSNIPTMSESWYCCAEPSPLQVAKI